MESSLKVLGVPPTYLLLAAVFLFCIIKYVTTKSNLPAGMPWVYKPSGPFSETRANFASVLNGRDWIQQGYHKYSKKGKTYIFPDVGGYPHIVVPREKLKWVLNQPDNVVSVQAAHDDMLFGDVNFTDPELLKTMFHEHVVHKSLFRNLSDLIPDTWDELRYAIDSIFGTDHTTHKDICVFEDLMRIIAHASNRMFVGLPLCRNGSYLANMAHFAQDVIFVMTTMMLIPKFLHPVFSRLLTIPNHIHFNRVKKLTVPLISQRLQDVAEKRDVPNDYLTWHIKLAAAEGNAAELSADRIARRLMPLNFAAIHTTTFTIVNTLFDLLGSDPSKRYVESLREEVERVFEEAGGVWDKTSLNKLVRVDSAIRESMRVSNFGARPLIRKVVAKEGLHDEEEGWTAPQGSYISVDSHSVMHDPDIYPKPDVYDAFRFSGPREEYEAKQEKGDADSDMAETLKMKSAGMITTSDIFMPFGHGRHACPGRFFVNHELKMLLAYVLMNYEVPYLEKRPENQWFGQSIVPPMKATIKIRRKPGTVVV